MKELYEELMEVEFPPEFMTLEEARDRFGFSRKRYNELKKELDSYYKRQNESKK